ncbi:MAG: hypothetical protein U1E10_10290 [Bdellovibrionales bacterium]|nr:hypothetical protein [Bdellovibrionales bacterium]
MNHSKCPRCGSLAYEHLRTHSYCWECGYSPDQDARAALKPPLKNRQPAVVVNSGGPGAALKNRQPAVVINSGRLRATAKRSLKKREPPLALRDEPDHPRRPEYLH